MRCCRTQVDNGWVWSVWTLGSTSPSPGTLFEASLVKELRSAVSPSVTYVHHLDHSGRGYVTLNGRRFYAEKMVTS